MPLPAIVSILTRISGIGLFAGMALFLYLLDASLASEASFADLKSTLTNPFVKFMVWGVVSLLLYHVAAGVKHLIADLGIGESLEGGILGAKATVAVSIFLIVLAGLWIW